MTFVLIAPVPELTLLNAHRTDFVNPYLTNGFSHLYQLDESTFIFRGVRSDF